MTTIVIYKCYRFLIEFQNQSQDISYDIYNYSGSANIYFPCSHLAKWSLEYLGKVDPLTPLMLRLVESPQVGFKRKPQMCLQYLVSSCSPMILPKKRRTTAVAFLQKKHMQSRPKINSQLEYKSTQITS